MPARWTELVLAVRLAYHDADLELCDADRQLFYDAATRIHHQNRTRKHREWHPQPAVTDLLHPPHDPDHWQ